MKHNPDLPYVTFPVSQLDLAASLPCLGTSWPHQITNFRKNSKKSYLWSSALLSSSLFQHHNSLQKVPRQNFRKKKLHVKTLHTWVSCWSDWSRLESRMLKLCESTSETYTVVRRGLKPAWFLPCHAENRVRKEAMMSITSGFRSQKLKRLTSRWLPWICKKYFGSPEKFLANFDATCNESKNIHLTYGPLAVFAHRLGQSKSTCQEDLTMCKTSKEREYLKDCLRWWKDAMETPIIK